MATVIARISRNRRNQVIRIPVELSLDAETVTIERQGDALILRPLRSSGWDQFFADPTLVLPPDFELRDDPPEHNR
jgi:virulence-associated protein VagC